MDKTEAADKLHLIGQEHLLTSFDSLPDQTKQALLAQIKHLRIPTFRKQQLMLASKPRPPIRLLDPVSDSRQVGHAKWKEKGKQAIKTGKAGALLLAGGQGSRLSFKGPKGCFPVSVIKGKSLFQLFAEKTLAAGIEAGRPLPLAIMTSPLNHDQTLAFFEFHQFFGLSPSQVSFFSQGMLPFLNDDGNLFLNPEGVIAEGPNGNGSCFAHFYQSGVWEDWYQAGVRFVNTVLIDNPLADPFDADLIGFHADENADAVIKCAARKDAEEQAGLVLKHNDRIEVIEYTEIPQALRCACDKEGKLLYGLVNLSLFSFSMDFIKSAASKDLPLHLAHKTAASLKDPLPKNPNAWKFETFIFDALRYAFTIKTLLYPRDKCFSPLKNSEGANSLPKVREALQKRDREIFKEITGQASPNRAFELSQQFYYPTQELLAYWQNKPFPDRNYIEFACE